MNGITKRFPGIIANDHIDFELRTGEVHGLLGENGAGKTTLMNILYGLYRFDEGEIWVRGKKASVRSPSDAISLGIGMVHQHFALVPNMTVAENVILGMSLEREPLLDIGSINSRIGKLSGTYNLSVDPKATIDQLSVGERQRVEIVKALYRGAQILILDEPTSVLTPAEIENLFKMVRTMAQEGRSVVLITHKLAEVMEVSDRITVLRLGRVAAVLETRLSNPAELAEKMIGRAVFLGTGEKEQPQNDLAMEVKELNAVRDRGVPALKNVSFHVRRGEILGIAGVAGNGQRELAEVLTGMRKVERGSVSIFGRDITNLTPSQIIERGIGHIPEDRLGMGLILDFSIAENLVLEVRSNPPFSRSWFLPEGKRYFLNAEEIRSHAEKLIKEFDIVTSNAYAPARTLSGGNLQKMILAKVLSRNPRFLVAEQPTSGLDVGATEFIWKKLREQKAKGVGILLISGDLNEIMALSDRVAVMYNGSIVGTVSASEDKTRQIGLMMGGVESEQ